MKYYPMQMHLHTCHQPGGSMEGHIYNAKKLGMEYIRFTDHDTRIGPKKYPLSRFDFSRGALSYSECGGELGFRELGDGEATVGDNEIRYTLGKVLGERAGGLYYFSCENNHTVSLIGDVTLILGVGFKVWGDARAVIDIRLSQRPPDHKAAHFRYVLGEIKECNEPHTVEVPLPEPKNGIYELRLSEDIGKCREVGGLDNVFDTATLLIEANGGGGEFLVREFEIKRKYGYDELIKRQRTVADEIGARYGVKPFVTTEISGAGQHKNVFSTSVPVIDYEKAGYSVSAWDAVRHVKSHGGIFAYNHPFENNKFKKLRDLTEEDVQRYVINEAASLISTRVYGASLIEVGFTEGRGYFGLREYLRLWDTLSLAGIFITGYGDSDSHKNDKSWFDSNNFASWIGVDENIPYPVPEDELIGAMKAGRVYMGDPVFLKFGISLKCEGAEMGRVIRSEKGSHTVSFSAGAPGGEYSVRIIADGKCIAEGNTKAGEDFLLTVDYSREYPLGFVRAEMYNADGRCIMLTNPIYFAGKTEFFGEIPAERLLEV